LSSPGLICWLLPRNRSPGGGRQRCLSIGGHLAVAEFAKQSLVQYASAYSSKSVQSRQRLEYFSHSKSDHTTLAHWLRLQACSINASLWSSVWISCGL